MLKSLPYLLLPLATLFSREPEPLSLTTLDPLSVSQHLSFYTLYGGTPQGQLALERAWNLLSQSNGSPSTSPQLLALPRFDVQAVVSLVTHQPSDPAVTLSDAELLAIERLSASLSNRKLKGRAAWSREENLALPSEEIDVARALLVEQLGDRKEEIRSYEAGLDLMALQIRARLKPIASARDKINAINRFVFQELEFRYPPHSVYAKDIDLYTFLPSVLDGREGVCLGVALLHLALAQRLDLNLEMVTPPGHAFVRYQEGKEVINIETTARGIDIPTEHYLGIDTCKLDIHPNKACVGLALMNEASTFLQKEQYHEALLRYQRAQSYLPEHKHLQLLMGITYLLTGEKRAARQYLEPLVSWTHEGSISRETLPEDYLKGRATADAIKAVWMPVNETRESILEKQKALEKVVKECPKFREAIFQLAITWLQLGRAGEAEAILKKYYELDPHNATVTYYLSHISLQRFNYPESALFLHKTEELLRKKGHEKCLPLKSLRSALRNQYPPLFTLEGNL